MGESGRINLKPQEHSSSPAAPGISCIIPTLARGEVLLDTLAMLRAQKPRAQEIIVVDQTPIHPPKVQSAIEALSKAGQIVLLHQSEPNAAKARNAGALAASGDILLFLDDDVCLPPSFLAAYSQAFRNTLVSAVAGQVLEGSAATVDRLPPRASDPGLGWLYFPKNYSRPCSTSFMMAGNFGIRRELYLKLGGMDEAFERGAYREESDFAMRFVRSGYRFLFNPACSLRHLGAPLVPYGGARHWSRGRDFRYFHHCVGDWYFNLKHANRRTLGPLLLHSLRYFVFNRMRLQRPWQLPAAFAFWASALPVATLRVAEGPRLLR